MLIVKKKAPMTLPSAPIAFVAGLAGGPQRRAQRRAEWPLADAVARERRPGKDLDGGPSDHRVVRGLDARLQIGVHAG